ncbi:MAG: 16S rRNA (cytosine(1402)-N(4))-methyltransferase RsmH [Bacilli bacterium]|nr:16S rRNA (cytosine(1402)-N(4))-methyltransferase RsmH [Bacilli bacterium]
MVTHVPVMLQEAIEYLNVKPDGTYVDMTLGGGSHSEAIAKLLKNGRLFSIDQDEFAIEQASLRLGDYSNVTILKGNFSEVGSLLHSQSVSGVDGFLFDLGVSSFQFDLPERGFSYQQDNYLDMRMDQSNIIDAYKIVNEYPESELSKIFFRYGEEPFSRQIARKIVEARVNRPIRTTFELVDIIKSALPAKILRKKGHPAKQAFQALRIAVNDELGVLEAALEAAIKLLNPGGRIVTITFHSLEDRICKQIFRNYSTIDLPKGLPILETEKPILKLVNKHVVLPSEAEILANNRAHSAKLRAVEKTL